MKTARAALRSVMAALVIAGGCRHAYQADTNAAAAPHIDAVRPDSVVMQRGSIIEIAIIGRGFTPGSPGMNTIEFAGMVVTQVPANAAGSELKFVVPDMVASRGEAAPTPLDGGTYTLRVKTAAGMSNSMTLRVYR